jgi:hypothetical protein
MHQLTLRQIVRWAYDRHLTPDPPPEIAPYTVGMLVNAIVELSLRLAEFDEEPTRPDCPTSIRPPP